MNVLLKYRSDSNYVLKPKMYRFLGINNMSSHLSSSLQSSKCLSKEGKKGKEKIKKRKAKIEYILFFFTLFFFVLLVANSNIPFDPKEIELNCNLKGKTASPIHNLFLVNILFSLFTLLSYFFSL